MPESNVGRFVTFDAPYHSRSEFGHVSTRMVEVAGVVIKDDGGGSVLVETGRGKIRTDASKLRTQEGMGDR